MSQLIKNPYTTTSALVEGKTIKDVVITTTGVAVVHNGIPVVNNGVEVVANVSEDYFAEEKCYLVMHEKAKMDVTTIDLERKVATFPAGMIPVGIKRIHGILSEVDEVTIIE